MIVAREPQQAILDRLVADVGRFVGDPVVGLRLAHPDGVLRVVASQGLDFRCARRAFLARRWAWAQVPWPWPRIGWS